MAYARDKTWRFRLMAFLGLGIAAMTPASAGDVVGWMEIAPKDGQLQIIGRAWSTQELTVDYLLQIQRMGRSGSSTSKQAGKATLHPGETAILSTSSVSSQS